MSTERQHASVARRAVDLLVEPANVWKSRFLATVSHDLRQPLQTLALLRWLLAQTVEGDRAKNLVARLGSAVAAMSRTLDTLLDVNKIEDGIVRADKINFPINELLDRLRNEFTDHARVPSVILRVVSCGLSIYSDPRLLEQMIRRLLSNALECAERGRVLLGCRRRGDMLAIEIWGIQASLDLSIVQCLGKLLGHPVRVRSHSETGLVCTVEIPLAPVATGSRHGYHRRGIDEEIVAGVRRTGTILVVESDPRVRERLEPLLRDEGHHLATALNGIAAMDLVARERFQLDLIVADNNLPGIGALQIAAMLRKKLRREIPLIILTGDISTGTLHEMALHCVQLTKPVKLKELAQVITVEDYATCETFLEAYRPNRLACLLVDVYLPGMNGLELLQRLRDAGHRLPAIMITGNGDVKMAVETMKAGASDFIEKPIGGDELLASVERALEHSREARALLAGREIAARNIASLTPRQREIMELVLAGHPSKNIATDLGISRRTVENHRAAIMKKTGSKSLPALARLAVAVASNGTGTPSVQTGYFNRERAAHH